MTSQSRWSKQREEQRAATERYAEESGELCEQLDTLLDGVARHLINNPSAAAALLNEAKALVARIDARQQRIVRHMVDAANGINRSSS